MGVLYVVVHRDHVEALRKPLGHERALRADARHADDDPAVALRARAELLHALPRRELRLRHRGLVGRGLLLASDEEVDAYVYSNCFSKC